MDEEIGPDDSPTETYRGRRPPRHRRSPAAALERGDALGRYVVLDQVGAGGMGVVYAAYDPELDRRVAIKVLQADTESSWHGEEARLRLQREARALAQVVHPNVVTIHDVGSVERRIFLAMEFVDGPDLRAAVEAAGEGAAPARAARRALRLYLEAGRGLAAVHAAGLAHRDFKPSNVRVGSDGRVRILDFGLALREHGLAERAHDPESGGVIGPVPADEQLTRAGEIIGTPRYMAPEQILGQRADAKSDQFSFCLALFEALHGRRPFAAQSAADMVRLVRRGLPADAAADSPFSAAFEAHLARGLAFDPADRHPDLASLLDALEREGLGARGRWRGVLAAVGLAVASAASVWLLTRTPPCTGAAEKLEGIWDRGRRAAVAAALGEAASWDAASALLDDYAGAWRSAYRDACEATHVRGEQSAELLDLRMACLEDRRQELRALTDLFLGPQPVDAVVAASRLSPLAPCAESERLLAPLAPPADAASARELAEIRRGLARSRARQAAGRPAAALDEISALLARSEALDYAPIYADAHLQNAGLLYDLGDYEPAGAAYRRAVVRADEGHHDEARARALIGLVWSEKSLGRPAVAAELSEQARAAVRRLGDPPDLLMRWYYAAAQVALVTFEAAKALELARAAVELSREVHGDRHLHTGQYLGAVASALSIAYRFDEALQVEDQAAEILAENLGEDHPSLGRAQRKMALQELMLGRLEAARRRLERSLVSARAVRDDHLVSVYGDLGMTEARLGLATRAEEHLRSALELAAELQGERSSRVAEVHNYFADAELELGDYRAAERHARRSLELLQGRSVSATERLAPTLNLALAQVRGGDAAAAARRLDSVRSSMPSDAFWLWVIERIEGLVALEEGATSLAVKRLESALSRLESSRISSPFDVHGLRLDLAAALRADGAEERARREAEEALEFFEAQGRAGDLGAERCRRFLRRAR